MTQPFALGGNILRINLADRAVTIEPTAPLNARFPAGMGVNNWLLLNETPLGKEPLDPDNPLIFTAGSLVGTMVPTACRMTISCKNVLTGGFGAANAGGNFAPELKYAGFDHIVVTGRAKVPVYIDIVDSNVTIIDADDLWGKTTWEAEKALRARIDRPTLELLSIGPAGENMAAAACIIVSRTRSASRCGVGAAIAGMRPIVEIQIFDFVALTMDMLVNQAAKFRFMLGGKPTVPLVVRGPQGGGIRLAAQHSQSLEAWFTHVPGLVVVAPSTPYDAKGLLMSAIRDDNPVIFLESKLLYLGASGPVPEQPYAIPLGKADIKRKGTDATVVATSSMVPRALAAAEMLAREGIEIEIVDPRTLKPLDEETILASVAKTNRLLIVHEAWRSGGFGAEVAAMVAEKGFDDLDAPIARIGALDTPMPYNDELERAVIPSQDRIIEELRTLLP